MKLSFLHTMTNPEPKITLKGATVADIDDYIALEKKVDGKTYHALVLEEDIIGKEGSDNIILFKVGAKTVGHITCQTKDDGSIHLGGFAIDPEYQGKGYGRKFMELILEKAKTAPKIDLVTHPDNVKAINLYRSFGFEIVKTKENYFGDGESRIIMQK